MFDTPDVVVLIAPFSKQNSAVEGYSAPAARRVARDPLERR